MSHQRSFCARRGKLQNTSRKREIGHLHPGQSLQLLLQFGCAIWTVQAVHPQPPLLTRSGKQAALVAHLVDAALYVPNLYRLISDNSQPCCGVGEISGPNASHSPDNLGQPGGAIRAIQAVDLEDQLVVTAAQHFGG